MVVFNDFMLEKMFYAGNSLFYYRFPGIYKTQENCGKEINLEFSVFTENCFQTDGKNYYVTRQGNAYVGVYYINGSFDYDIYKMSFDGKYNEPIY